jgi:hypothetical protein
VHVLDNGGNALDASSVAILAALLHFRRADVTVVGEVVTVHPYRERAPVPLSIHHTPVSVTFGVCSAADNCVFLDPSDREELVMDGRITYSVNAHRELCGVHKIGACGVALQRVGGAQRPRAPRRMRRWPLHPTAHLYSPLHTVQHCHYITHNPTVPFHPATPPTPTQPNPQPSHDCSTVTPRVSLHQAALP